MSSGGAKVEKVLLFIFIEEQEIYEEEKDDDNDDDYERIRRVTNVAYFIHVSIVLLHSEWGSSLRFIARLAALTISTPSPTNPSEIYFV